ncbi:LAQU0S05e03400g1_1 [Lachancea quebecensis]|uniref:LAQU0S05e03400g1_1 n=1 Tax=Lachancea quebecensis TaxID=1654605 RepID=A0A0P1KRG3_9SACH|nr:LAQU0S05e03400g1_1 [Lachancea quebecensis]
MTNVETGMLDVGTHCAFCRQLDFLPFHCKQCGGEFCSSHRTQTSHRCASEQNQTSEPQIQSESVSPIRNTNGEYFATLLPEKGHIRVKQTKQSAETSRGTGDRSVKDQLEASGNKSALEKLKSFFGRRTSSRATHPSKKGPANRHIQLAKLKQSAKGDPKIPITNRVYAFCFVVDAKDENVKHELFVNKIWPVGRALDYIASQLAVQNLNNSARASVNEKLFLYRDCEGVPTLLDTSSRVAATIHDADILYLVRGEQPPAA